MYAVIAEPKSRFLISSPVNWFSLKAGKYPPRILDRTFLKLYGPLFPGFRIIDFYGN
jgi:hypothetical protein